MSSVEEKKMTPLSTFLVAVKEEYFETRFLPEKASTNIHVVLGNEACDLDSAVCCLAMAYFLSRRSDKLILPVLCIQNRDYCLRTEVCHLFDRLDITSDQLTFLDDINLTELHSKQLLELTLVDHNVLASRVTALDGAVTRVIDHHKWERTDSGDDIKRTVEMTGSCATLVAELILSEDRELIDSQLARLLQSAIIVDTVNFSPEAKKATPKDVKIFEELKQFNKDFDWSTQYVKLLAAKENVGHLSVIDLLRKDLKIIREKLNIAIPSVPTTMVDFVERSGQLPYKLEQFRVTYEVDAIVALLNKSGKRWIVINAKSDLLCQQIYDFLDSHVDPCLNMEVYELSCYDQYDFVRFASQGNVAASRKAVLPILREFATEYSEE